MLGGAENRREIEIEGDVGIRFQIIEKNDGKEDENNIYAEHVVRL